MKIFHVNSLLGDYAILSRATHSTEVIIPANQPRTPPYPTLVKYTLCRHYQLTRNFCLKLGLRPFGVSFIYAGYDSQREFQLYQSNPSGNYGGWKATSVGANNASAQSLLKQDYKEDCDLKEACGIAVKVLSKTMDSTTLSSEKSKTANLEHYSAGSILIIYS